MIYQWCTEGWYPWKPETEDDRILLHSALAMDYFFGGTVQQWSKGACKTRGGHHVNYSLKGGGGGGVGSYLKKRVSLYKKKATNGGGVPPSIGTAIKF